MLLTRGQCSLTVSFHHRKNLYELFYFKVGDPLTDVITLLIGYEWGDEHGIWYATRRDGGDFSDWAYYLPGAGSSSTQTRFASYSQMPKDVRATGFVLDGDRAFYEEGGKRLSNWFALPVEGKKGLYTVEWGTGSVKGKIDITLSKKAP